MTSSTLSLRTGIAGGVLLSLIALTVPSPTYAQLMGGRDFCAQVDTVGEQLTSKLTERTEKARTRHQEQAGKGDERREARMGTLASARGNADSAREQRYEKLRAQATTDVQEHVVEDFIATVETLVEERRVAIDASIETFEDTVAKLEEERNAETDSFIQEVETAIQDAVTSAQTACDKGDDAVAVRKALLSALEETRTDFAQRRESYTYREQLQEARTLRHATTESAWEEFRTGFKKAQDTLKTAFGIEE